MGVNNFDVTSLTKAKIYDPREVGYKDSIEIIYEELHKTRQSFVKIGWYLKHIYEEKMYAEDGYADIYELAKDKFDISQSTTTRFMNLCSEFSVDHDSPELDRKYIDFSISQLFEMLPMEQEEKAKIDAGMTIREIRDPLELYSKNEEHNCVTMVYSYTARTALNDLVSSYRASQPCKCFSVKFDLLSKEKYQLVTNTFGFLDSSKGEDDTNNDYTSYSEFKDWIFEDDGVIVSIVPRPELKEKEKEEERMTGVNIA